MAEYPYERYLRDARINLIFEGTNEILRLFIALSGLQKPGEYLKEIGKALHAPIKAFGLLQGYVGLHIQRSVAPPVLKRVAPALMKDAARLSRLTMSFADQCEAVLRGHGRAIVDREYLQKRLADAAIDLYAISACLSRATLRIESSGEEGAREEIRLAHTFTNLAVRRIRRNLRMIDRNSDRRFGDIVRWLRERGEYRVGG
jgi:acyl-CoA dehydrogenase family protein 9